MALPPLPFANPQEKRLSRLQAALINSMPPAPRPDLMQAPAPAQQTRQSPYQPRVPDYVQTTSAIPRTLEQPFGMSRKQKSASERLFGGR